MNNQKMQKDIVNKILQEFQSENHILFRDQEQARALILKALGVKQDSYFTYCDGEE